MFCLSKFKGRMDGHGRTFVGVMALGRAAVEFEKDPCACEACRYYDGHIDRLLDFGRGLIPPVTKCTRRCCGGSGAL